MGNEQLKIILDLIEDEVEAIKAYEEAIKKITNSTIIEKLKEIKDDEEEHVRKITSIVFSIMLKN